MPNRAQKGVYDIHYRYIADRDGEYCIACFCEGAGRRGPESVKLQIDHADNNPKNWIDRDLLHIVCQTHNLSFRRLNVAEHIAVMAGYSAKNESERLRLNLHQSVSRRAGLYIVGSPEMQVNSIAYVKWKDWIHEQINAFGSIPKEIAIELGAKIADDIDIQTTDRYYRKNRWGPEFMEISRDGKKFLIFKPADENPATRAMESMTKGVSDAQSAE